MSACIVCNNGHVPDRRSLDDVVDHAQTLRLRLEKVFDEPVLGKGWMCSSCQLDLKQIETYYSLVVVFKQRYRDTAWQLKQQVNCCAEDGGNHSLLLDKSQFRSESLQLVTSEVSTCNPKHQDEAVARTIPHAQIKKDSMEAVPGVDINSLCDTKVTESEAGGLDLQVTELEESDLEDTGYDEHGEPEMGKSEHPILEYDENPMISRKYSNSKKQAKSKYGSFTCPTCRKVFKRHVGLQVHMRIHVTKPKVPSVSSGSEASRTLLQGQNAKPVSKVDKPNLTIESRSSTSCRQNKRFKLKRLKTDHIDSTCTPNTQSDSIGKFKCTICGKIFKQLAGMKIHMSRHTSRRKDECTEFPCTYCNKKYLNKGSLMQHVATHTGKWRLACSVCNKGFMRPAHLKIHMIKHTNAKPHICDQCGKRFKSFQYLKVHMKYHTGETLACSICKKRSLCKSILVNHMKTHTVHILLPCQLCEKTFTSNASLSAHIRSHKGKRNPTSDSKTSIRGNVRSYSEGQMSAMKHPCWKCGKTFHRYDIKYHMLTHTGERKFSCSICSKRFYRRTTLSNHMRVHSTERPFSCSQCSSTFKSNGDLTIHKRMHADLRPFKCKLCEKSFKLNKHLIRHGIIHTDIFSFSCPICGRCFRRDGQLKSHMNTHSDESPFPCTICGITFRQDSTLKRHLLKHAECPDQIPRTRVIKETNAYSRARKMNMPSKQVLQPGQ